MKLLTVKEVAGRLRVGQNVAYDLCKQPNFPAMRVGKLIRVPEEAFNEWVHAQAAGVGDKIRASV